ncbi:MAG: PilZ domain-containing protein [Gammaproteobacteria bacterium]|nr:PilZ domain-containing protein [Gammaproteobacteria bacterium]
MNQQVTVKAADSSSVLAMLIDISKAGLCLAGVPAAWQPEHRVPFHLLWGDRALRFFGRVAWRCGKTVGIELEDRTPEHDAWIDRVLQQIFLPSS